MKTGILFDLDGTLLDTLEDLTDSVNYALAQFDCPPITVADTRRFLGNGAKRLITLSLPRENAPDADAVLAIFRPYYDAHCRIKTGPYAGIPEALGKIGEKYPVAIVSNKPDSAVKPLCRQHFPGVYAMGEIPECPRKPAPDMLLKAMADIGVETFVYVGDSEVDVQTAANAGMPCVAVSWGFRDREDLIAAGAKYLCDEPRDLPAMIEKILGETNGK